MCVIWIDEGSVGLRIASFSNGVIHVNDGDIFLKDGNYLTRAGLKNGKFQINDDVPLSSPKPLEALTKLLGDIRETSEKNKVTEQFNTAGCTTSKPVR